MKPIIIIPPGQMSQSDIKTLRDNEICVVVAKNPERVRFMDPIPSAGNRGEIESAAIKLSRLLLNPNQWSRPDGTWDAAGVAKTFVQFLTTGTALDSRGTKEEQEKSWHESARREQIEKMAKEEAKAEREAAKKALLEKSKPTPPIGEYKTT